MRPGSTVPHNVCNTLWPCMPASALQRMVVRRGITKSHPKALRLMEQREQVHQVWRASACSSIMADLQIHLYGSFSFSTVPKTTQKLVVQDKVWQLEYKRCTYCCPVFTVCNNATRDSVNYLFVSLLIPARHVSSLAK